MSTAALVSQQVRTLRTGAGLSQEQLAVKAGLSSATVGRIEAATHTPSLATLAKLAEALGVTVAQLVADAGAS